MKSKPEELLKNKLIIKLGGSLISVEDGKIDQDYLKEFAGFIRRMSKHVNAIFIVVGGGKIVRNYQEVARNLGAKVADDIDTIGMRLTRVNAELVRTAIGRELAGEIIYSGGEFRWFAKVVVGAGWGHAVTSDYNAVLAADMVGAHELIRLSNIDHIYDSNPKKNPSAKPQKQLTWQDLENINRGDGNDKFKSGMNVPLDPKAVSLAKKLGLRMAFMHGHKLDEVEKYINSKKFEGTYVIPKVKSQRIGKALP